MPNEPTILVKKADGSFVRVPLSQVKKQGITSSPAAPHNDKPPATVIPPKQKRQPYPTAPIRQNVIASEAKQSQPSKPGIAAAAARPRNDRNDFHSPLEEPTPAKENAGPSLSAQRPSQVDDVMKKINFPVPQNFVNRLRSIIQLRLKDVRSSEETKSVLLRSIADGGMGFTENQAIKVIGACEEMMLPATATPFNAFEHSPAVKPKPILPPKPANTPPLASPTIPLKLSAEPPKRDMRDITAPPVEMGPVDEVKYINLTDFRRLSQNATEAAQRLGQKFVNLRDESYLLFIEALSAWKQSPLYLEYMRAVCDSLVNRKTLTQVLADKNRLQINELKAIVAMESEL